MSPFDFDSILDDCIARLQTGASLTECLRAYPQHSAALQPLLALAAEAQTLPAPQARPPAVRLGRDRLRAAIAQQFPQRPVSSQPAARYAERSLIAQLARKAFPMGFILRAVYAFVSVFILAGIFAVTAAAESLPGDQLYGVKRSWEEVSLFFAFPSDARANYEAKLALERRREVSALMAQRRTVSGVSFTAMIQAIELDEWTVSALPMRLTEQTDVQGQPAVGDFIAILGDINKGELLAAKIIIPTKPVPVPCSDTALCATKTPTPTHRPTKTSTPTRTPTATGCNDRTHCPTKTPTPCKNTSAARCPTPTRTPCPSNVKCRTRTPVPCATVANCPSRTPTVTATPEPKPSQTPCPASVCSTPVPCTNDATCPTATPTPTRTPCAAGTLNCITPTRTPCTASTPNCITPTRTPCPNADCVTATPLPTRTLYPTATACNDVVKCSTPLPTMTATSPPTHTPCPASDCRPPTATPCTNSANCITPPPTWTLPPPTVTLDPCAINLGCNTPVPSATLGAPIPKP
jgi:hypothetical protein